MLSIQSLTVNYGSLTVLKDITLQVAPGEIVAVIGPNGAGKSTLIRAISGVLNAKAGEIVYQDQKLNALSNMERARILGVVPQAQPMAGAFTVEQTVSLGRTAYMDWLGRARAEDRAAVLWAMQQTNIEHLAQRRNASLSGGEHQRVFLARALAQKTPVLLLDEPTNHLDLQHQVNFLSLVRDLARRENLAVLMALHDLNQVAIYADRAALLVDGKLVALGTPVEVLTETNIKLAYHVGVQIIPSPDNQHPVILPRLN